MPAPTAPESRDRMDSASAPPPTTSARSPARIAVPPTASTVASRRDLRRQPNHDCRTAELRSARRGRCHPCVGWKTATIRRVKYGLPRLAVHVVDERWCRLRQQGTDLIGGPRPVQRLEHEFGRPRSRLMSASQRCRGCPSPTSPARRVATTVRRRRAGPAMTYMSASSVDRSAHCTSSTISTTCAASQRRVSHASNPTTASPSSPSRTTFAACRRPSSRPRSAERIGRTRDQHRSERQARAEHDQGAGSLSSMPVPRAQSCRRLRRLKRRASAHPRRRIGRGAP